MDYQTPPTSLRPYVVTFTITILILSLIMVLFEIWFDRGGMNGIKFILPFLAAMFAAESFLKKERRLPTAPEKSRLVWSGLGIYVLIEIVFTVFSAFIGGLDAASEAAIDTSMLVIVIAGVLLFVCLANFFLMRWAYGGLLKTRAARLGIDIGDTFD